MEFAFRFICPQDRGRQPRLGLQQQGDREDTRRQERGRGAKRGEGGRGGRKGGEKRRAEGRGEKKSGGERGGGEKRGEEEEEERGEERRGEERRGEEKGGEGDKEEERYGTMHSIREYEHMISYSTRLPASPAHNTTHIHILYKFCHTPTYTLEK